MIINGPSTANYDIDLGAYPITDWFHSSIFTVNAASLHANGPPTADNVLVNGSMTSSSGGQYAVTTLTPGKSHKLHLINVGINNWVHVGLDGHKFTVVAADFVPIVPFETDFLNIAVGKSCRSTSRAYLPCPCSVPPSPMFTNMHMYLCDITLTPTPRSKIRRHHLRQRQHLLLLAPRRHRRRLRRPQRKRRQHPQHIPLRRRFFQRT
jgi:hypothetical protein